MTLGGEETVFAKKDIQKNSDFTLQQGTTDIQNTVDGPKKWVDTHSRKMKGNPMKKYSTIDELSHTTFGC